MFNLDTIQSLRNKSLHLPSLYTSYEKKTPHALWCNAFMAEHSFSGEKPTIQTVLPEYGCQTFLRLEREGGSENYIAEHYNGPLLTKIKYSKDKWEFSNYAWRIINDYLMDYEGQDESKYKNVPRDEVEHVLAWWGTRRYERPLALYKLQVLKNPTALSFLNSPVGLSITATLNQKKWFE